MLKKSLLFIILFSIGFLSTAFSQENKSDYRNFFNNWSVNANFGANQFFGDISNLNPFNKIGNETKLAYGIILTKEISPYFALRGQILNGTLYGEGINSGVSSDNLYFEADVFEYNISGVLNFSNIFFRDNLQKKFSFYGVFGLGLSNWNSELKNSATNNIISKSGFVDRGITERTTELVGPIGLGVNYNISSNFILNIETSLRTVNSDVLDAVEGGFDFDSYSYTSFGFTYKFNNSKKSKKRIPERVNLVSQNKSMFSKVNKKKEDKISESKKREEKFEESAKKNISKSYRKKKEHSKNDLPELLEFPDINKVSSDNKVKEDIGVPEKVSQEDETVYNEGKLFITGNSNNKIDKYIKTKNKSNAKKPKENNVKNSKGIVFSVQVLASRKNLNFSKIAKEKGIKGKIYMNNINGWYKYSLGNFNSYRNAKLYRNKLNNIGFYDAFVVKHKNGF